MEKTYHRFARLMAEEVSHRRNELGLTQAEVEERGGPSRPTQREIEKGRTSEKVQINTLAGYDKALEWPAGTMEQLASGIAQPRTVEASTWADLKPEVRKLLRAVTDMRRSAKNIPDLPLEFTEALTELTELQTDIQERLLEDLMD